MRDFLARLSARALNRAPLVEPLPGSRFEAPRDAPDPAGAEPLAPARAAASAREPRAAGAVAHRGGPEAAHASPDATREAMEERAVAAPVGAPTTPVRADSAPTPVGSTPVRADSASVPMGSTPVRADSARMGSTPAGRVDSAPAEVRRSPAVGSAAAGATVDSAPATPPFVPSVDAGRPDGARSATTADGGWTSDPERRRSSASLRDGATLGRSEGVVEVAERVREVEETLDAFPAERRRDRSVGATDATVLRRSDPISGAGRAEAADRPAPGPVTRHPRPTVGPASDPSRAATAALRSDAGKADAGAVGATTTAEATLLPPLREARSEPIGPTLETAAVEPTVHAPVGARLAADSARFAETADATLLPIARRSEPAVGARSAESARVDRHRVDSRPARRTDAGTEAVEATSADDAEPTLLPVARRSEPAVDPTSAEPAPTGRRRLDSRPDTPWIEGRAEDGTTTVEATAGDGAEPTLLPIARAPDPATSDAAPLHRPRKTPDAADAATPTIRVSVGRVEIRAKEKPAPRKPAGGWKAPVLSLDHYLRRGSGA